MQARKRFGQHFLTDSQVLDRIVDSIHCQQGDHVLEIGPGHGALTDLLVGSAAYYLAVEVDRDLVPLLRARHPSMQVVNEDILKCDLVDLLQHPPGLGNKDDRHIKFRVIGNLPYNISSPILLQMVELVQQLDCVADMHFMLQQEMADRLCASPGSKAWGRLGVLVQLFFTTGKLFSVSPGSFSPPPRVDSAVVRMVPRHQQPSGKDVDHLQQVLRLAFSGRRKRLSNSLKPLNLDWAAVQSKLGLTGGERADDISKEQFLGLARLRQT